ncbi:SpaA isopeptide-forming pilin-related protein [Propionibacterium australiense]|nr:Ig-like domain-containing protein [Propionibacterium australiense]
MRVGTDSLAIGHGPRGGILGSARRLLTAALGVMLLVTMLAVLPGHREPAVAEQSCAGSFSNFAWREGPNVTSNGVFESRRGGVATVTFHWSVKEGSRAGDYFTLEIPAPIRREQTLAPFWLDSPTGEHIAYVTWDGQTTKFTLTEYVENHSNVSGDANFSVDWQAETDPGDYQLNFQGCDGSGGTLPAHLLQDPPPGYFQKSGKNGSVSEVDSNVIWWLGLNSATAGDVYEPTVIHDQGGDGYVLSCDDMTIADRTPSPYTSIDDENYIDTDRWSCQEENGGVTITFNPDRFGRYIRWNETLLIVINGRLTADYKDFDRLHNVVDVDNSPQEASQLDPGTTTDHIEGYAEVPHSGGSGIGETVTFSIIKYADGDGQPEAGQGFVFEYKCLGTDFMPFHSIAVGETTNKASTKSSATCTIREKDLPPGVTVRYSLANPDSGATVTDNGDNTATLSFAQNAPADVQIYAVNTFPGNIPIFTVEKKTSEDKAIISGGDTELQRQYTVTARNIGTAGGDFPEIIDHPGIPTEGFRLSGVDVDGQPAAPLGGDAYRLSSGDYLDPGQEKQYTVTVRYAVEPNAITASGQNALGSCADGDDPDPTKGLYNKVTMEDDADGPENNDACTPAELRGSISWEKVDADGNLLAGSSWQIQGGYDTQNWTTIEDCTGNCQPGGYADQDPESGKFRIDGLGLYYYWIRELNAPEGYDKFSTATYVFPSIRVGALGVRLEPRSTGNNPRIPLVNDQGQIINYPKGTVAWKKNDDSGEPLAGSVWHIRGGADRISVDVADCVADSADECSKEPYADQDPAPGSFLVKGLTATPSVSFYLTETRAPFGYATDKNEYEFRIDPLTRRYEFSDAFVNKKVEVPSLPLTGGGLARDLLLITGGLALAGSSATAFMKHRRRRLG